MITFHLTDDRGPAYLYVAHIAGVMRNGDHVDVTRILLDGGQEVFVRATPEEVVDAIAATTPQQSICD